MPRMRPSLMRAVGAAIAPDGSEVTVYLARSRSRQLLQDVAATGQVAVVFSEPLSHRTVQVKAREVELRSAVDGDAPVLKRYLRSMEHEIGNVGLRADFVQAMLALPAGRRGRDPLRDRAKPTTRRPGPKAGSALPAA